MPNAQLLADTAKCLRHFTGAAQVSGVTRGGSILMQRTAFPLYDFWMITDNGGEINVERVNCPDTLQSIPSDWFGIPLDAGTMAYRVACVMDGTKIDYHTRMDDCLDILTGPAID